MRFSYIFLLFLLASLIPPISSQTDADNDYVENNGTVFPKAAFKVYSGFLNVSATKFLHYMFFESNNTNNLSDPLVLWLNGGPGCSSLEGAFQENGPFIFNINATGFQQRVNPYSWNLFANMLYLETPAGVGFSNGTEDDINNCNDFITTQDNLQALSLWFDRFPRYRSNDFYITGESYAGTYVPFLAWYIHNYNLNPNTTVPINLKGWAVGNGCTHPTECVERKLIFKNDSSTYVYDFYWGQGKYSPETRKQYESTCMINPNGPACMAVRSQINIEVGIAYNEIDVYDIYRTCYNQTNLDPTIGYCNDGIGIFTFLKTESVQEWLHVNRTVKTEWNECNNNVGNYYVSNPNASYWIYEQLVPLNKYKILIFSGDTDSSVPITGTLFWINQLRAELQLPVMNLWRPWYYPGKQEGESQVAGYVMELQGLTFASVRGVGHMVPQWAPQQAYIMLSNFIAGNELPSQ